MTESKIFDIDFTNVEDHAEQWAKLLDNNDGLKKILEVVKKPGKALVFSHDDPDGITSGLICKRMLLKKGWKVKHYMPEGFKLQPEQFEKALKEFPEAECVFILDKGTSDADDFISDKLPCYVSIQALKAMYSALALFLLMVFLFWQELVKNLTIYWL